MRLIVNKEKKEQVLKGKIHCQKAGGKKKNLDPSKRGPGYCREKEKEQGKWG